MSILSCRSFASVTNRSWQDGLALTHLYIESWGGRYACKGFAQRCAHDLERVPNSVVIPVPPFCFCVAAIACLPAVSRYDSPIIEVRAPVAISLLL